MSINPENNILTTALTELKVTVQGMVNSSEQGLIASNFFVPTNELGALVIRINDIEPDSSQSFETTALHFLADHNAPVPEIVPFEDGEFEKHLQGKRVIAYKPIEGATLSAEDIKNPSISAAAGQLLAKLITVTEQYAGQPSDPDGDNEYIARITASLLEKYPDLSENLTFRDGLNLVNNASFASRLSATPQGIVHADYFYENIIQGDDALAGVIDFGDAYYGSILNDIVIGSMEFSVVEDDENWDRELFAAFVEPHADWLKKHQIDFDLYHKVLLANCVRFAVYTLGFERDDEPKAPADDNRYIQRFISFNGQLSEGLKKSYQEVLGA